MQGAKVETSVPPDGWAAVRKTCSLTADTSSEGKRPHLDGAIVLSTSNLRGSSALQHSG